MIPHIPTKQTWQKLSGGKLVPVSLAALLAVAATAEATPYRYIRFQPLRLSSGGIQVQLSEFELYNGATKLTIPQTITPTVLAGTTNGGGATTVNGAPGTTEGPQNAIDGDINTKWFNFGTGTSISYIQFDAGDSSTFDATAYRFATANDSLDRTPIDWKLSGSNDGTTWTTLDIKRFQPVPAATFTFTDTYTIPAATDIEPEVSALSYSPVVVLNGKTSTVTYTADRADTVQFFPEPATTFNGSSGTATLTPPPNETTIYSLSATNAVATAPDVNFPVKAVAGANLNYEYVRFTPIKVASGTDIQIADINFQQIGPDGTTVVSSVTPIGVTFDGSADDPNGGEGPMKLIDNDPTTKWFNNGLRPIVFQFNGSQPFNRYSITLAADAATYTGRNIVQWKMEGKVGENGAWKAIEDFTSFDYPTPAINGFVLANIPFPGNSIPLSLSNFYATRTTGTGSPTTLHWTVAGEQAVTLTANGGTPVDVTSAGGVFDVTPPAPNTLYTLTATSALDPSFPPLSFSLTLSPAATTVPALPNFTTDFGTVGQSIVLNGSARIVNDYPTLTLSNDQLRLSIAPDLTGQNGSAWFVNKVPVSTGIDTTFNAFMATKDRGYGAEGLAFSIQNSPDGTASLPTATATEQGPVSNALTIELSTWDNNAVAPATLNQAMVDIYRGSGGTVSLLTKVDLKTFPDIVLPNTGYGPSFTGNYDSPPFKVRVTHGNGLLNVYVNDVHVLTDYPVALGDIVDGDGKAYVGFLARNGGYGEFADVSSWTVGPLSTQPTGDLKITASAFDFTTGNLNLTFTSNAGTTYKVTHSATLNGTDWVQIGSNVAGAATSTSTTVPFTKGVKDFFRVEVVAP